VKKFSNAARYIFIVIFHIMIMAMPSLMKAEPYDPLAYMDSVEFSLITCSPHEEIYSLYGHTALRVHDLHEGKQTDVVFNWGIFNFKKPHFIMRFVFGLTDYELGIANYAPFCKYYQKWGSSVTEQVLNLNSAEKLALDQALKENYQEENRTYRYNFFYDNCSTRPRDIIERSIQGRIAYPTDIQQLTFREMIYEKIKHHEWNLFGIDMLLGLKADLPTSREEQEFLPNHLLYDFDNASIISIDGTSRALVKEHRMGVTPGVQMRKPDFLLSPIEVSTGLLILSVLLIMAEIKRKKTLKYWDVFWMLITGLAGCVLFVMMFSQHPTTTLNMNLLLVNPIHLFFIPQVLRRRKTHYWNVLITMIALFFLGAIFQHYNSAMYILALCLLTRFWIHKRNAK
jgi:hypothetical protein